MHKNPEAKKAYDRAYREANREKIRASHREYARRNASRFRDAAKKRYQEKKAQYLAYQREYRAANPEKQREYARKSNYGITKAEWDALFQSQGRVCGICGSDTPGQSHWSTDHDHQTGRVRGILCRSCNLGLGSFKDSVELLGKAIQYLGRK